MKKKNSLRMASEFEKTTTKRKVENSHIPIWHIHIGNMFERFIVPLLRTVMVLVTFRNDHFVFHLRRK